MLDEGQSSGRRRLIRNPQDFFGGLVLVGVAAVAFWTTWRLPGIEGFSFGAGTVPRLFAAGLLLFGGLVMVLAVVIEGPPMPRFHWRGPLLVAAAVVLFAFTLRPWGLVLSAFSTLMLASIGTNEIRWIEAIVWSAVLTLFCALVFPYGLSLPLPLWPR